MRNEESMDQDALLTAALFDLDGTLIDTEPQYSKVWGEIGLRYLPDQPTFHKDIKGTTLTQILHRYFPDPQLQRQIEAELDRFEAEEMIYKPFPGAFDCVRELREKGVRTAIVTSSNQLKMSRVYRQLPQLPALFDAILTSEDFRASKPDPDCFLTAASRLRSPLNQCVIFEDALTGLEAGMRSGMLTIGLATSHPAASIQHLCHAVASDWHAINYKFICQLLQNHNQ